MKKRKSLIVIALIMLLAVVVGATYAYFAAQRGSGGSANIEVGAGTTDSLTFQAGNAINITASSDDFYKGAEDKTGSTTAIAKLVPNNTTNEATDYYNVYFIIDENDFTYSSTDEQVELLLKITDPDGEAVTNIDALAYNEELQGFDITKRKGAFKVALKDEIKATDEKGISEEWQIEVTLRNLEVDQQKNTGKTFQGKVLITTDTQDTYIIPELNSITDTSKTFDSITVNLLENEQHTAEIDKYYYAIEETTEEPETAKIMSIAERLEPNYIESDEPTYTFTEINGEPLKDNQSYKIYAYFKDVQGIMSNIKTAVVKTDKYQKVQVTGFDVIDRTLTSIKVKATASDGDNPVKEYAFKIEDHDIYGNWSTWQTSPEFTFSNLADTTTYNIQIKVRDEINKESIDSYDREEKTLDYVYPSVNIFTVSDVTSSAIKVNGTFNDGSATVSKVEYQINEDINWYEGTNTNGTYSYLFTSLEKVTSYTFKIKVTDSNNREKILEDASYTGTTLNNYLVQVQVTGGTSKPSQAIVDHGKSADFAISASNGYLLSTAKVTEGTDCNLSTGSNKKTLTVSNVTSDRTCKIELGFYLEQATQYITRRVSKGIIQHTSSLADGAADNSYRFYNDNPNNFVCFGAGSEDYNNGGTTCPDTNLYRIIGVFDIDGEQRVKLIKSEYLTSAELGLSGNTMYSGNYDSLKRVKVTPKEGFYWNDDKDDYTWSTSTLFQALNNETNSYLSKLGSTWTTKIAKSTWHIGGYSSEMVTPKVMYDAEIASTPTVSAQIGLMYVSDYGYAGPYLMWNKPLSDFSLGSYRNDYNRQSNWLYNNVPEWTISPYNSGYSYDSVFLIDSEGGVMTTKVNTYKACGVRPAFYLKSDTKFIVDSTKDGSVSKPYRIAV